MNPEMKSRPTPATAGKMSLAFFCHCACWLMLALGVLALAGCQTEQDAFPEATQPVGAGFYATNILHAGDVVNVTFQYATNYSTLQRIALDGTLNMNSVGPVTAAGRTVVELQTDLARAYQALAKDDVITVTLVLGSTAVVYVSGAVLKPGPVEMNHPLTVIEAVMASGGFDNSRAKLSDVTVLRVENGWQQAYHVNLKRVLEGNDQVPFYLKPFDIVYVPEKIFNY
jgi:polysaccharide export outer membrane protein